jgi:hypothetical protein
MGTVGMIRINFVEQIASAKLPGHMLMSSADQARAKMRLIVIGHDFKQHPMRHQPRNLVRANVLSRLNAGAARLGKPYLFEFLNNTVAWFRILAAHAGLPLCIAFDEKEYRQGSLADAKRSAIAFQANFP